MVVFESVMAKITKCLTMVIYTAIGIIDQKCLGIVFGIALAENYGFAKEASFDPKTAISAMNLKLHVATCLHFPQ